jgi:hypothetical protein
MTEKTIFIASANESRPIAEKVAQALGEHRYRPVRWWKMVFPGAFTIDALMNLARTVDGAVFLFTGVDKTWYRGAELVSPRDNVTLEYGLFVGHLGRERVLILKDDACQLASDINSISFSKIGTDIEAIPERTLDHFKRVFDKKPDALESIPLLADPGIVDRFFRPLPHQHHFRLRDLYAGISGAKAWMALTNDIGGYPSPTHDQHLLETTIRMVEGLHIRTLVSFGPGSADKDERIATNLRAHEPWLEYIGVDISDPLLQNAMVRLNPIAGLRIGIVGDFEDRFEFIEKQIKQHARLPALFFFGGNTLGNIEGSESNLLAKFHRMMTEDDYFLFDVSLAGVKWSRDKDPRATHAGYSESYRRFFSRGISLKTGEPVDQIVRSFEQRFEFRAGYSAVKGTNSIDIVEKLADKNRPINKLAIIRRYNFDDLSEWLKTRNFEIINATPLFDQDEVLGDAIFLVKRK